MKSFTSSILRIMKLTNNRFSGALPLLLLLTWTLSATPLFSQDYRIIGRVTDAQNLQPLAFVNIVVNDGCAGGISDINGKYAITSPEPITAIKFSYLGYKAYEAIFQTRTDKFNIALTPIQFELAEVTVNVGENPAHRIIDSVMAHRATNNPNHLGSYTYSIYDKMIFTPDSTLWNIAAADTAADLSDVMAFSNLFKSNDMMVMETFSDVLFMAPDKKKQNVTGTKISGMKDPTFIYLVNSMQSINFYEETVGIVGTDYLNPLSEGNKKKYFFNIESAMPIGNGDSLYVVSFHPYKGLDFDGLKGMLTINTDGWAVQSVKASPNTSEGGFFTASIQQLYEKTDGQWFPKQFNTNLTFPSIGVRFPNGAFVPMAAIGKSYVSDIRINPSIDKKQFSELAIEVDPHASYRDDDFWITRRIDSLNERTQATYRFLDSLTEGKPIFDIALGMTTELAENGHLPIGKVSIDLNRLFKYSMYRGYYLGLGIATNRKLSKLVSFNLLGGYWTRLKEFDYEGGILFNLNPRKQTALSFSVFNKSDVVGGFNDMQESYNLLAQSDYKYEYYENVYNRKQGANIQFASRVGRNLKVFLTGEMCNKRTLKSFSTDIISPAHYATMQLRLRYAYKELFISSPQGLQSLGTVYPIAWFSYEHSFKGFWNCPFEYDRFQFQIEHFIYTKTLGISDILFQAGYATQSTPVVETFDILGSNASLSLYAPNSFSTMRPDEFFCDRFVALYLSHNFSGSLWRPATQWCRPELTLVANLGWGDMRHIEDLTLYNFKTMEKGYFESGVVIEGLINMPLMKLGGGLFYRYGPYAFDKTCDNFVWKWSVKFTL